MPINKPQALRTRLIHNHPDNDPYGSPYCPVYNTTTYRQANTRALLDTIEGRADGPLYTRWGSNPTIEALEQSLAMLEQAPAALAFASGMAAISATLLCHGHEGIVGVGDLYGGTLEFLEHNARPLGYPVEYRRYDQLGELGDTLRPGMLVYCETPANPTLRLIDIAALAEQVHHKGALLMVDNTFATPINQQPLTLGADLVVHSASKYLGGHSDITAGALMGDRERVRRVASWRTNLGQILSPETAALLARSLRTLPLRVRTHNDNALALAQALETMSPIRRVLYPGLASFAQHELAKRQMCGFGGMLSIELEGDFEQAAAVADRLKVFVLAPSLGGLESLVSQPCATSHHGISREQRMAQGISDSLLRLSVGVESVEDLISDIQQALDAAYDSAP